MKREPCGACPHNPPDIVAKERVMRGAWIPCVCTTSEAPAKTHHVRVMQMRQEEECIGIRNWRRGSR